ncbi:MAG: HAMP domain-containing histidine kinase [Chloroflexi bacterium]|nr:HAMP domain-containing histidine kinase [Chloroflexota bacterium]
MFRSLRAKLIASYTAVIVICLTLSWGAFIFVLRGYQQELALSQLADATVPIAVQVGFWERDRAPIEAIGAFLNTQAGRIGTRVLLIENESQRVAIDTGGSLVGTTLTFPPQTADQVKPWAVWQRVVDGDGQDLIAVKLAPRLQLPTAEPGSQVERPRRGQGPLAAIALPGGQSSRYSVVLAVPQQKVASAWLELLPSMIVAALASLVASVLAGWGLSRSIAEPIRRVTKASEQIARGRYDQEIEVRSRDELGRLAATFNTMAHAVAQTNRSQRDFLANVSHDLRTPLTSIQGFSQAMIDGTLREPRDYAHAAQIINDEAARMHRLVDDLLDLSRLESGQSKLNSEPVDVTDLLRICVRRFERNATAGEIDLSLQADALPPILGDVGRLEQVFANLLDNAVKHTPSGGRIVVKAKPLRAEESGRLRDHLPGLGARRGGAGTAGPAAYVSVSVENSGSYIEPEELERVFERFYQVDKSRARGVGSGLGLAIVREIVQAHGGVVEATSDRANGTCFVVRLPVGAVTSESDVRSRAMQIGALSSKASVAQ